VAGPVATSCRLTVRSATGNAAEPAFAVPGTIARSTLPEPAASRCWPGVEAATERGIPLAAPALSNMAAVLAAVPLAGVALAGVALLRVTLAALLVAAAVPLPVMAVLPATGLPLPAGLPVVELPVVEPPLPAGTERRSFWPEPGCVQPGRAVAC
jgi:hypothetical protein